jgi:sugar lactone lactonase YvrE
MAGYNRPAGTEPIGQLYRLDGDGKVQLIVDGFVCSNGPSFSPDGRVTYHTQTHDRVIYAYDIDVDTGETRDQRIFAIVEPDTGVGLS